MSIDSQMLSAACNQITRCFSNVRGIEARTLKLVNNCLSLYAYKYSLVLSKFCTLKMKHSVLLRNFKQNLA